MAGEGGGIPAPPLYETCCHIIMLKWLAIYSFKLAAVLSQFASYLVQVIWSVADIAAVGGKNIDGCDSGGFLSLLCSKA